MKRVLLLSLMAGCLDSIVDNPCEDGYTLDDEGTCVLLVDHGEDDMLPPAAEDPTEPIMPPTLPPDITTPPTTTDPTIEPDPTDDLTPCPTCH